MRYIFAIIALVIAGVLLVLGVGQRTFLAGPDRITLDASPSTEATYAMISADTLDGVLGRPVIELRGTDSFAAVGSQTDVEAWLMTVDHVVLTMDSSTEKLIAETMTGVLPEKDIVSAEVEGATTSSQGSAVARIDPRGSDLWIDERSDAQEVSFPVALQSDQAVLIATNGTEPLPVKISVDWIQSLRAPLSGPFLVGGVVFGLAGAILYLLAVDHDRRGLGPRRGRRGPLRGVRDLFTRAAWVRPQHSGRAPEVGTVSEYTARRPQRWIATIGLVGVLSLTGCSADYWPDFTPASSTTEIETPVKPEVEKASVPLTDAQIDRIITDVAEIANEADDGLDAELLQQRFTGDALAQRTANYKIRGSVADYQAPPRITNTRLDYELVQSTESWPRTLFVMVESASDTPAKDVVTSEGDAKDAAPATPSLALVLTQESPRDNFRVTHVTEVRGGITMPPASPAEEGTALLAEDLKTLRLTPDQVGDAYADILQNGENSSFAADFDLEGDLLLEKLGLAWATNAQAEANAAGQKVTHSVSVTEGIGTPVTLSTGERGALISVVINDDLISTSSDPQSKVKPTPSVTALSGLTDSQDRIVQNWTHQMLFFVPSADSGQLIRVLGSTSAMIGAGS